MVPFFSVVYLVGEPSHPKKEKQKALLGDLADTFSVSPAPTHTYAPQAQGR